MNKIVRMNGIWVSKVRIDVLWCDVMWWLDDDDDEVCF